MPLQFERNMLSTWTQCKRKGQDRYSRPCKLPCVDVSLVLDPSVKTHPYWGIPHLLETCQNLKTEVSIVCVCVQETWFPFLSLSSSHMAEGLSAQVAFSGPQQTRAKLMWVLGTGFWKLHWSRLGQMYQSPTIRGFQYHLSLSLKLRSHSFLATCV